MLKLMLSIALAFQALSWAAPDSQERENNPQKSAKPSRESETRVKKKPAESTDQRKDADEAMLELRQWGAELILLAAEESAHLDDKPSAVRVQALAADLLWKHDQGRARQLFQRAFAAAVEYHRDGKGLEQEQLASGLSLSKPDLRLEVIRLISKHDAQLSRQFTDQYVEEKRLEQEARRNKGNPQRHYDPAFGAVDEAGHDSLHIAKQLLDVNKKEALGLAEQAFVKGVPQAAGYLFAEIAERDRAMADQLYLMALDRLQRDELPVPGQLLLLAAYPFGDENVWVSSGDGINSYHFPVSDKFIIDEKIVQRFIATAFTVLARNAEAHIRQLPDADARLGAALFAAKLLRPRIAKYSPDRLDAWQGLINALSNLVGDQTQLGVDKVLNQISNRTQPEAQTSIDERIKELLNRAQNTNNFAQRDELYQRAALLADQKPDTAYALELADKISNREHRKKLRSWLNFEAAIRAINARKLDEAYQYAIEVEAIDQSAYLFLQIARVALADKDLARAGDLLAEAAQKAVASDNTLEKLRALLALVNLYSQFDSPRGLDLATEAVRTANKIQNYGPDQARLVRSLETPSGKGLNVSVEKTEEFDLGRALASLARADLEGAWLLAQSLENKPLRLMAVISVAASVFENKPAKQTQ